MDECRKAFEKIITVNVRQTMEGTTPSKHFPGRMPDGVLRCYKPQAGHLFVPARILSFRSKNPAASCRQYSVIMMIVKTHLPESMISAEYDFSLHRLTDLHSISSVPDSDILLFLS